MKTNVNRERNEAILMNTLNNIIKFEMEDKTLKNFSITYTKLSKDKSVCDVYIDFWNKNELDNVVKKLNDNSWKFRKALSQKLSFYKTPNLVFKRDIALDNADRIDNLLKSIKNDGTK